MLSGVPNAKCGEKVRSGYLTLAFSGAKKRAEVLRNLCILGGPQRQAWGENQKWLRPPCLLGGGGQMRAEVLRTPSILGGPQRQSPGENEKWLLTAAISGAEKRAAHSRKSPMPSAGIKSEAATSALTYRGRRRGRFILGALQRQVWGENQKWLPHSCLFEVLEHGGSAK